MDMSDTDERQIDQLAKDLEAFIHQRFNYKRKCAFAQWSTIDVHLKRVQLYLRFKPKGFWPDDTFVIARIEFERQREGHGTALLRKLVDLSGKYGYGTIGVEALSTPAIHSFVRKFGFTAHQGDNHWIISIDDLRTSLDRLGKDSGFLSP